MPKSYQNSQPQRDFRATETIQFLTDLSPLLVIGTTLLSLFTVLIIDTVFKISVFVPKMGLVGYAPALLIPITILIARLGFGLLGAFDISKGRTASGVIGLIATFLIAIYEHHAVTQIAVVWEMIDYTLLFQFMVWLAVGAELRLMMTLSSSKNIVNQISHKLGNGKKPQHQPPNQKLKTNLNDTFSLNVVNP